MFGWRFITESDTFNEKLLDFKEKKNFQTILGHFRVFPLQIGMDFKEDSQFRNNFRLCQKYYSCFSFTIKYKNFAGILILHLNLKIT